MPVGSAPQTLPDPTPGERLIAACGPITVINLPERRDRREEFEAQLQRIGLSFTHPQVRLFPAVRPTDAGNFPGIGARGCFLSHLGVLQAAAEAGEARILLCEDDLNFSRSLETRAPYLAQAITAVDWDIFYGFVGDGVSGESLDPEGQLIEVPPDRSFICAHMIGFNHRAIALLVPYLEAMLQRPPGDPAGGAMHVDGAYNWFRAAHPELRTVAVRPDIGYQRASMTNIAPLGAKDRVPFLRELIGLGRRLRNLVNRV